MSEKEKAIADYMKKLDLTREEAEQLWLDDNSDFESDEMREMREKARKNGTAKVTARSVTDPAGKTKTRERKPNEDKRFLIDCLNDTFKDFDDFNISNPEREVTFNLNGIRYSVTLTAHRKKKEDNK